MALERPGLDVRTPHRGVAIISVEMSVLRESGQILLSRRKHDFEIVEGARIALGMTQTELDDVGGGESVEDEVVVTFAVEHNSSSRFEHDGVSH